MISESSLMEWWPKFVNGSDLVMHDINIIHKKPNMSGNILIIFVFLWGGLSLGLICIVLELRKSVFVVGKMGYAFCATKLHVMISGIKIFN